MNDVVLRSGVNIGVKLGSKDVAVKLNEQNVPVKISSIQVAAAAGYSAAAQAVFAKMPNPLTDTDKTKIAACIDYAVTLGIYNDSDVSTAFDYFTAYFLDDPDNALVSWFGSKTAIAVNSPTHVPGQGYSGDGATQYIDDNVPLRTGLTNSTLNNVYIGAYVYDNRDIGTNKMLFGIFDGTQVLSVLQKANGQSQLAYVVSSATDTKYTGMSLFTDNTLFGVHREISTQHKLSVNGSIVSTGIVSSLNWPNGSLYTLARNRVDISTFDLPINATVSYKFYSKASERTNVDLFLDKIKTEFSI